MKGGNMFAVAMQIILLFSLSTLPTLLYPVYAQEFHFSELVLTVMYALYVVGTLATLLFFGGLSDALGRRRVALMAIGLAALASCLFVVAHSTAMLALARIVSGFAVGLSSGTALAWMRDLHGRDEDKAATLKSVMLNIFGLGFGPLLAGIALGLTSRAEAAPYVAFLVLLVLLLLALGSARETVTERQEWHAGLLKPRIGVPSNLRRAFVAPATIIFVVFSLVGFYSAIVPNLLGGVLHIHNPMLSGLIIFELFLAGVIATWLTASWSHRTAMVGGTLLMIPALVCLAASELGASIGLLVLGTALGGCAVGLGYRGSLEIVHHISPPQHRSEMVSSLFVVGNISISIPVVGVGLTATWLTSFFANVLFAALLTLLAVFGLVFSWRQRAE